jgi:hypothetical protein
VKEARTTGAVRPAATGTPLSRALRWTARGFFAAALLAAGYGFWLRRQPPPPTPAAAQGARPEALAAIDWAREPFQPFAIAEVGISLLHPARFDVNRGFGRFTSRDLAGGIKETDLAAFRCARPRAVIAVASYRAPREMTWSQWLALARAPLRPPVPEGSTPGARPPAPSLSSEFGGSDLAYRSERVEGRAWLRVSGRGALRYPVRGNDRWEVWRFESRFAAEGHAALRITAGVHADHHAAAREGLERALASFRWEPRSERRREHSEGAPPGGGYAAPY